MHKLVNKDFDTVTVKVVFSPNECVLRVYKTFWTSESEVIHSESHEISLKTMPLQVASSIASAHVANLGLVDFVDDEPKS